MCFLKYVGASLIELRPPQDEAYAGVEIAYSDVRKQKQLEVYIEEHKFCHNLSSSLGAHHDKAQTAHDYTLTQASTYLVK